MLNPANPTHQTQPSTSLDRLSPNYYPPAFRSVHNDGDSDDDSDDSDGSDDSANGSEVLSTDSESDQIESFVLEWKRLFNIHIPSHLL